MRVDNYSAIVLYPIGVQHDILQPVKIQTYLHLVSIAFYCGQLEYQGRTTWQGMKMTDLNFVKV